MRKRNVLATGVLAIGMTFFGGTAALANSTSYNMIVPGSVVPGDDTAYSNAVAKASDSSTATDNNSSIGAGNTLNSAVYFGNDQITATSTISSGGTLNHTYNTGEAIADRSHRLGHNTQASTVVDVQSSGTFTP